MTPGPVIAFYGDDFTGATDTLSTAARAGLRSMLFFGVPTADQMRRAGPLDCVGIAGSARSMGPAAMRAELAPVAAFFATLLPRVAHYKICSTFDSAPEVGNIAVAVEVLRRALDPAWIAVVGGQPSLGRYCVFGNLFASAGHGGDVMRIDRHPTMSRHPVTPMQEADLAKHLALQGLATRAVHYPAYAEPGPALQARVAAAARAGAVLFDVSTDADLAVIGTLLDDRTDTRPLLAVGPSSVCEALVAKGRHTAASTPDAVVERVAGPVFVHAGSLSPVTARQVEAATSYRVVRVDPGRLARDDGYMAKTLASVVALLNEGAHVIACSAPVEGNARSLDDLPGRVLAEAGGRLLGGVLDAVPMGRIGVAGGDTSSLAVQALDAWGLTYETRLAPGVALCRLHSNRAALDGCEIMLKGGQMGPVDVFERLLGSR